MKIRIEQNRIPVSCGRKRNVMHTNMHAVKIGSSGSNILLTEDDNIITFNIIFFKYKTLLFLKFVLVYKMPCN